MALRIINGKLPIVPQAPQPKAVTHPTPQGPEDDADSSTSSPDPDDMHNMSGMVPPQNAGYMGPENGPFVCHRCEYFNEPNSCEVVSGNIDPNGCCNNFTPDRDGDADEADTGEDSAEQTNTANYGQ